ncbi:MAG: Mce-associated rane protein [Nocardioidaceae bacterium]|nr:Mce-associated rane protein [Nocardioidaceae bacterium]
MTPTWYDLLGVEPDASDAEIRAAWKVGIADLDPGDRKFRALNEAAEVLLDPDKRAAYDLEVAPDETQRPVEPVETPAAKAPDDTPDDATSDDADDEAAPAKARGTIPAWLLAAMAILVAILVAAAGYLVTQPSDNTIASSTSEAQGAAERAATTILAYDYRHLDDDQKAAGALMTPAYQKKYDALFSQIAANAPEVKAIVTVDVVASGIVRSGADRVQVLVFVNRPTLRADKTDPTVFRDQVVMTMEKSGGDWLVDDMDTNQLAG